jgi:bacterioferritin-associated ferredoxin
MRPIDRCVCRNVRFAELIRRARESGMGLAQLQEATACGTICGLCIPYIRVALRTGRAQLPVMRDPELRELGGFEEE